MLVDEKQVPENVKIGKAKAMEVMVLTDGTRLYKKTKVRYWVERQGAREDFYIYYKNRAHRLTSTEFKRRFKVIIKGGAVKLEKVAEDA